MKTIKIKGYKNNQEYDIEISQLVMGSGDYLRLDNMPVVNIILDKYKEIGGNAFDTARHYRHSEQTLKEWMSSRNAADDMVIFTKGCHPVREFPDVPRVNPECIEEDINKSLEILGLDHVALFALHRDDRTKPVGPLVEKLNDMINAGKIHAYGLSNWELDRIIEADEYARNNNLIAPSFNSPNLSLAQCQIPRWPGCVSANDEMIAWHTETKLPLISWSSQAGGFFSGRYDRNYLSDQEIVDVYYNDDNWERYDRATKLAQDLGKTPIQIALAYVLNQPFPTAAAIGTEKIEELMSSYDGANIKLSQEQMDLLNLK